MYNTLGNAGINMVRVDAGRDDFIKKWIEDADTLP